jgi:hypothetical protein
LDKLNEFLANMSFWVAVIAWALAQLIKLLIDFMQNKRPNIILFFSSGGMPSSHSAFVCALTVHVGLTTGFDTAVFAICLVSAIIVMHDAAGVRRAAGKQAEAINMLVERFDGLGIELDNKLKEMIGHSPLEVMAGAVLGITVAAVLYVI